MEKGNKMKIGVLLPANTSYPIGKAFLKGLKEQLGSEDMEYVVELIKGFTRDRIQEALAKCFEFDEVDLVVGLISAAQMEEVEGVAAKYRRPVIACHLGEHIPSSHKNLQYVRPLSLDIWKDVYALGYFSCQNFGPTGLLCTGFYEAGFGFGALFEQGMKAYDKDSQLYYRVLPQQRDKEPAAYGHILADLEAEQLDFVLALFHGEEASLFASAYQQAKISELPLVGLPFFRESIAAWSVDKEEGSKVGAFFSLQLLGRYAVNDIYEAFGKVLGTEILAMGDDKDIAGWANGDAKAFTTVLTCEQRTAVTDLQQMELTVSADDEMSLEQLIITQFADEVTTGWTNSYLAN